MTVRLPVLSEEAIADLRQLHAAYRQGRLNVRDEGPIPLPARINTYLARATGTITAAVGDTLGSGPVVLRRAEDDGGEQVVSDSAVTMTAYNDGPDEIGAGTQVKLIRESVGGPLMVVRESGTGSGVFTGCLEFPVAGTFECVDGELEYDAVSLHYEGGLLKYVSDEPCISLSGAGSGSFAGAGSNSGCVTVTVTGFANGTCTDCATVNRTYRLCPVGDAGSGPRWQAVGLEGVTVCGGNQLVADFGFQTGANTWFFRAYYVSGAAHLVVSYVRFDAFSAWDQASPFVLNNRQPITACDESGAPATITVTPE
jgi:hypothetical protein